MCICRRETIVGTRRRSGVGNLTVPKSRRAECALDGLCERAKLRRLRRFRAERLGIREEPSCDGSSQSDSSS